MGRGVRRCVGGGETGRERERLFKEKTMKKTNDGESAV